MSHSGLGQRPPKTFTVTVSGGEGSTSMMVGGNCIAFAVKAPSQNAVYDAEFTDQDGYGLAETTANTGNRNVSHEFQLHYDHAAGSGPTLTISNATIDGTYTIRVWFKV